MCLAIYKPANQSVPTDHLEEGFMSNSHGAGFAYLKDGVIVIRKGYFKFKDFIKAYNEEVNDETPALIHFRFATHGKQNKFNCHPWDMCDGKFVAIHNGILNIQSTNDKSDTGHFVDLVLTPVVNAFGDPSHHSVKYLVEQAIGSGNKIVVMSKEGEVTIYNEKAGTWDGGVWYSNCGYISYRSKYSGRSDEMPDTWWNGYKSRSRSLSRSHRTRYTYPANAPSPTTEREPFPDYDGSDKQYFNALGTEVCEMCSTRMIPDEIVTTSETWGQCCENCTLEIEAAERQETSHYDEVADSTSQAWENP